MPPSCADMAGRRIVYLASFIGCLVFYYFYREWLSWLFLVAVGALPWLSLLLSLPAIFTARSTLSIPASVCLGQDCRASLVLTSAIPLPNFHCKFRITHAITGKQQTLKSNQPLPTDLCGLIKIQPIRASVCDHLGLFRFPLGKKREEAMYIWPNSIPLDPAPDFTRRGPVRWKPKPGGGFAENHELRPYRPGDNLQQIHWKLSAKTGQLILREAMEPIHPSLRLTLDLMGTQEEINLKLGRLLWLGQLLVEQAIPYRISALTGQGIISWQVADEAELKSAITGLLSAPAAESGTLEGTRPLAGRTYHIGGEPDEP